ncbi:MAG: hypothetical protein ACI9EH_000630, partial [Planktomarina sp.]
RASQRLIVDLRMVAMQEAVTKINKIHRTWPPFIPYQSTL